jgi:hypothetical protein
MLHPHRLVASAPFGGEPPPASWGESEAAEQIHIWKFSIWSPHLTGGQIGHHSPSQVTA